MNKSAVCLTAVFILVIGAGSVFGQSEEAKRHFDYGEAAVKMKDYEAAIKEFEQAARFAPNWPDVFYDLGVAQEGAEKYADAVKSYREYLRLAPNASDAEEVKSLINKLEYMAIPVPEIAKGVMGIPWGASQEQIIEAMNGQGYQLKSQSENGLTFANLAGGPLRQIFLSEDNALNYVQTQAFERSGNPQVARAVFSQKYDELSEEYGPPKYHNSKVGEAPIDGHKIPHEGATWVIIDSRTSIEYDISLEYTVGWYTDTGSADQYMINVYYSKGIKKPSEASPSINTEDTRKPSDTRPLSEDESYAERLIADVGGINSKDNMGFTPLHLAVDSNKIKVAELLIAKGADIRGKDNDGQTPLHWAAFSGKTEMAKFLITKGADVNAKDIDGKTPLFWAMTTYAPPLPNDKKEMAMLLIAEGADVDAKNKFGSTPLGLAAYLGAKEVAETLIAKGADINVKNKDGWTPLHEAAAMGQKDVAELLISKGAEINGTDIEGNTPLQLAKIWKKKEVVALLKKHGAR